VISTAKSRSWTTCPRPSTTAPGRSRCAPGLVLERVEGGALAEDVQRLHVGVPPDRLEQRMAGRDPLQLLRLGRLAVGGAARIAVGEGRQLPVRVLLVAAEDRGGAGRLEGVRQLGRPA
jgi:hypothetical protein